MIYLFVIILLLFLSFRYDINGKTRGRDQWYMAILIIFILIAGLRWRIGTDTAGYLYSFYHRFPALHNFSFETYPIGKDPFFVLMNSIIKTLGGRFYMVQLIHASFVNGLIFKYIKRHSPYIFTCVFFYAIMKFLGFNTEIMRGSMSIVICLFANDYFLEKKWIKGYALLLLALMFHAQTIVMFIMPLFLFIRFNRKGVLILIGSFVVGQIVGMLLNDYMDNIEFFMDDEIAEKAQSYAESENYGVGMDLKWMFTHIFVQVVYLFATLLYIKRHREQNKRLLVLEPLIMFYCMFLMINAGFRIAYRYVEYYSVYAAIFYAYVFVELVVNNTFKRGLSYARAFILLFPIVWLFCRGYILRQTELYKKYFPYSSVIEMRIDKDREELYYMSGRSPARFDEY